MKLVTPLLIITVEAIHKFLVVIFTSDNNRIQDKNLYQDKNGNISLDSIQKLLSSELISGSVEIENDNVVTFEYCC